MECMMCGKKDCSCMSMFAGLKVLVGLVLLAGVMGYVQLNWALGLLGLVMVLKGLLKLFMKPKA
ncbi:hypothetical protein HYT84_00135 [Candidatus Micrarchaeota archaeon]|nr:hypothetical protein [Candidatus Micrarchaeota archaeon]